MTISFPYIMPISEKAFKDGPILDRTHRMGQIRTTSKLFMKRNEESEDCLEVSNT